MTQFVRPRFTVLCRSFPAFQLCGYTGLLLAFIQSAFLVHYLHLSQFVLLGMTAVVVITFFAVVMATKLITGKEQIIYYHHEIAVLTMLALFLRLMHQPLLAYLDIASLGIGLFLACGRIGCLMVGCCHGRACKWGVCYTEEHAAAGFPSYLVGVRLFPIQLVESIFVLGVVLTGIMAILRQSPPGTALLLYIVGYGIGRFWLEFFRGDAARPYWWGFSQAQWISLLLAIAVLTAERARIVPAAPWHWIAAAALLVSLVLAIVWRHFDRSQQFELLQPRHVEEIIGALRLVKLGSRQPDSEPGEMPVIHVAETSLGYRFSTGRSSVGPNVVAHYTVSRTNGALSLKAGQVLSRLIAHLEQRRENVQVIRGDSGVLHLIFRVIGDNLASERLVGQRMAST
jgi:hypothetical protein